MNKKPLLSNRRMTFDRLRRLTVKELREILRDRRTVVTLILMPLLVYPMLSLVFHRFLVTALPAASPQIIVSVDKGRRDQLVYLLKVGEDLIRADKAVRKLDEAGAAIDPSMAEQLTGAVDGEGDPELLIHEVDDVELSVREFETDIGIVFPEQPEQTDENRQGVPRAPPLQLIFRSLSHNSRTAQRFVEDRLNAANDGYYRQILFERTVRPRPPARFHRVVIESATSQGFSIATLAPLILILMTITGAVYPAIDLTAGERERGTLETLMAAPAPRLGILFAKYIAVLTVAMLTATVNLTAMTGTIYVSGLGAKILGPDAFSFSVLLQIFVLLFLFASFFSAVLLTVTSMARSFKEAQAYLIPLMLVSLAPGIFGAMPGLEMNPIISITPLVNIVLLARDLLNGVADPTLAIAAIASTLLYTGAALGAAASIFGGDAVLYGAQGSWRSLLRRPESPQPQASLALSSLSLAIIFPLYFLVSGLLSQIEGVDIGAKIMLAGVATPLLFGVIPLAACVWSRVQWRSGLACIWPSWLAIPAALLLGLSMWPFAHELVVLAELVGVGSLDSEMIQGTESMLEKWRTLPVWAILLAFAVAPAIFEELFFRGMLFGSLLKNLSPWKTIVISAFLFGAFHVVGGSILAIERLLPSACIGLFLGYLRHRSGSVAPGIIAHMLHNGFLLGVVYYRDELLDLGIGVQGESHLPLTWLAAAAVALAAGVLIARLCQPPGDRESAASSRPSKNSSAAASEPVSSESA